MRKNSTQTRSLLQKIHDNLDVSDFLKPFFFVFETGYWGGLLTRTIAIYAIYLMLGMTPYGINIVTNQFFATLSGDSLTNFYYAAGFFITLRLSIPTLDSIGKMLSTQLERAQSKQGHNTFTKTEENHKNLHKKINRFTDEERAKKAAGLRQENPTHTPCQIDKILNEEEAKLNDQCGFRIFDQVTVFSNINKISGQFLRSIASVIVNVHFMIKIGMARACYTLLTGMVAVNIGIVYYAWRVMKPLDKKLANTKNTFINMWKSKPLPISELEEKDNEYDTIYDPKISRDTMIDIFNNCIRDCALPLGIFVAVFSLAGGVFPVTSTILASGTPLTTGIIIATATAIERIILDTSIFAKNYKDLYQAGSNFENIDILLKRGGITAKHRSITYLGSPRNPSFFDHMMHHGFFATTAWAALAIATDLTSLGLGSSLPLVMLIPTLAVGIVAFIGMSNTNKTHKPNTYDYIINAVFATILTITALIVTSGNANLLATVAQIAPSLAQKVHLGCGVAALFYTLSSTCTYWLKPSQKQLEKVQKNCGAQVTASGLVAAQVPADLKPRTGIVLENNNEASHNDTPQMQAS